jgi:hypothetical protein
LRAGGGNKNPKAFAKREKLGAKKQAKRSELKPLAEPSSVIPPPIIPNQRLRGAAQIA